MWGMEGRGVFLAYIGSILSALLCIVYGIINWNKPKDGEVKEIEEEVKWETKEPQD